MRSRIGALPACGVQRSVRDDSWLSRTERPPC